MAYLFEIEGDRVLIEPGVLYGQPELAFLFFSLLNQISPFNVLVLILDSNPLAN